MKLALILLVVIPLAVLVILNYIQIVKQRKRPNYLRDNIVKVTLYGILWVLSNFDPWYALYCFFFFGATYDILLELVRGKEGKAINYSNSASWTDKFVVWLSRWIPIPMQMFIEAILALLFMTIYWAGWAGFVLMLHGQYNWERNWIW